MSARQVTGRATRTLATLALAAAVASCDAPTASRPDFAFDPTTLSEGRLYRWRSGQQVRVWVDGTGQTALFDLPRAVRQAVSAWNVQPRFAEFELSVTVNASEAQVLVFERSQPVPVVPGSCAFEPRATVGYTYFCGRGARAERLALASGSAGVASVVIRIDRSLLNMPAGLEAIVAHEFGHALGVGGHSGDAGDLMFGLPRVSTPSARDSRTLQYVLGAPADVLL